jgi:hypothetical protein
MSADATAVLIGMLCLGFYLLSTIELIALARPRAKLPGIVGLIAPESLHARGIPRVLGIGMSLGVALFTQALVLYVLIGRVSETGPLTKLLLGAELLVCVWWVVWAGRFVKPLD